MEIVERLFAQYGYLVLVFGLPLELIALPISPGNSTLAYTGYLSYKNDLKLLAGSSFGIFWIGARNNDYVLDRKQVRDATSRIIREMAVIEA
ncbi:hypothetical protein [Niallia sp. Krafla_26]|uniref:hypothetical protein n=1 Tax=Niallia sp. Krafla_26 TaxID=3064703 RepID=UPI003D16F3A2